ncbi:hypothetical protein RM717_01610 [Streptomyces griseus]|uniref:Uncharacterized protein n=1 Tax=Streptomyces stephensoniae TaxID=3375367 RepID=A0ABU2VUB4_9ACTN|nr:hypothetical protein [Streptomyces griseus]MDT0489201.1 hypothetical protein [Streptomyces griseus]
MPTPERAEQPSQQSTPSALSMKDLLASYAAATAVSTPPSDAADEPDAARDGDEETGHGSAVRRRAA